MKHLPIEHYPPLARKSVIFYRAAKNSDEITNRTVGSEEVSYYLLSHSLELAIKALVVRHTGQTAPRIHDKQELSEQFKDICNFNDDELETIRALKELNDGPGGLRYDNQPVGEFLPSVFSENLAIVERLLERFE